MKMAMHRTIGEYLTTAFADALNWVAAGAGDNTEQSGPWTSRGTYGSMKMVITYEAVLAQDKTLTLAANLQDAADSSGAGAADYGDAYAATVVATGDTGGSTEVGTVELNFDLTAARTHIRSQFTGDLSNTATDTARVAVTFVFGPAEQIPVS